MKRKKPSLRRRRYLFLLLVVPLLGALLYRFFAHPTPTEAAWYDTNFSFRKLLQIANSGSQATDFQVQLTVDTEDLISDGKLQADCDDLRFTNLSGKELPFWIEPTTCNTTETLVWVKVDVVHTSGTDIYLYYGNPQATTGSSVDSTFIKQIEAAQVNWPLDDTTTTQSNARVINQGEEEGRNMVINGTFDSDTIWTKGTGVSIAGGVAVFTSVPASNGVSQTLPLVQGKAYEVTYTVSNYSAGNVKANIGGTDGTVNNANGTYTQIIISGSTTTFSILRGGSDFTGDIDNITVTQVNIPSTSATATQLITDGDMESSGTSAWIAGNSAVLSKQTTNPQGGSQVLRVTRGSSSSDARQEVLTIGQVYRVTGYARSDGGGIAVPLVLHDGGTPFTGTTSTSWQPFDFVFVATGTTIYLRNNATSGSNYVEFDDVVVSPDNYIRSDEIIQDGDMEASGTGSWTAVLSGTTLSKETTTPQEGTQTLRVTTTTAFGRAEQYILVTGKKYRVQGYMRGDGSIGTPQISNSSTVITGGTGTSSNSWQFFDLTFIAVNSAFSLNNNQSSGYAEFDDVSITEVSPLVGLPANGVTLGTSANGHLSTAYSFDGSDDSVNVYSSDLNSVFNPDEGAIVAWAKVADSGVWTDGTQRGIIFLGSDQTDNFIDIFRPTSNNDIIVNYRAGGTNEQVSSSILGGNTNWFQVVVTWSKSSDQVKVYFNGSQVGSTQTGLGTWSGNFSTSLATIGSLTSSGSSPWSGLINDVRLYDRALAADEIRAMYDATYDVQAYHTDNYPGVELLRKYSDAITTGSLGSEEVGPGPVAYWTFDEGQGQTAEDSTTNNNDGTLGSAVGSDTNDPTWVTEDQCITGKCLQFDGVDTVLTLADNSSLNLSTNFSVSMWVRPTGYTGTMEMLYQSGTQTNFWNMNLNNTFFRYTETGIQDFNSDYTPTLTDPKWLYLTIVKDGDGSNNINYYVNGIPYGTASAGSTTTPSGTKYLGNNETFDRAFKGFIDEVTIYSYARSAAQVKADYAAGAASLGTKNQSFLSNGLIGYWKMDEAGIDNEGETITDSSGNNRTGTLGGDNSTGDNGSGMDCTATGKHGTGCSFDGTDDYISLSPHYTPNSNSFTVASWINLDSAAAASANVLAIFGNDQNTPFFGYQPSVNRLHSLRQYSTSSQNVSSTTMTTTLADSSWHHVAMSVDQTTYQVTFYVDGALVSSHSIGTEGYTHSNGALQKLGNSFLAGSTDWQGSLDEMRLYNRALSPDEVQALYSFAPGPVAHWNFDEGSGSTAYDSSGNTNNITLTNGVQWDTGKFGDAVKLDGTDDYITSSAITGLSTATVEMWVNFDPAGVAGTEYLFDARSGSGTGYAYTGGGSWGQLNTSSGTVYINGVQTTTGLSTSTWTHIAISGITLDPSTSFILGTRFNIIESHFKGKIDDVKIYNYARTQSQILEDMQANPPPSLSGETLPDPIAHYKLDEQQGQTANNSGSIGSTVNGTLGANTGSSTDDPTWKTKTDCKINGCLSFDGGDNVDIGDQSGTEGVSQLSWSFWMNPDTVEDLKCLLCKYNSGDTQASWAIETNVNTQSVNNSIVIGISTSTTDGNTYAITPANSISAGTWKHVSIVFDGTQTGNANRLKVYINSQQKTLSFVGTIPSSTQATTSNVKIGSLSNNGRYFDGSMDEIKIYNTALTADQVKLDMNAGSSVDFNTNASAESTLLSDGAGNPPVAHWTFDEKNGTSVNDLSGTGNTGTLTNNPLWITGKVGSALRFDGSTNYVLDSSASLGDTGVTNPVTISAWIRPTEIRSVYGHIMSTGSSAHARIYTYEDDLYFGTTGLSDDQLGALGVLSTNQWKHITMTYDGAQKIIYINGVQVSSEAATGTLAFGGQLWAGARSGPQEFFKGDIDDLKVYNYARTPAQVAYDYNRGKPIAHFRLDECQGSTAHDASDNGNHGTITIGGSGTQTAIGTCNTSGSAWGNGATGKFNNSLNFDGTDDKVGMSTAVLNSSGNFTLSTWIRPSSIGNVWYILTENFGGSYRAGQFVLLMNSTGKIVLSRHRTSTNSVDELVSTGSVTSGAWNHVVTVYSGNDTSMSIYINGKLDPANTTVTNTASSGNGNTTIGSNGADNSFTFNGQIDDVQIYNYALSAAQVKQLYNGSAVRFGPSEGSP